MRYRRRLPALVDRSSETESQSESEAPSTSTLPRQKVSSRASLFDGSGDPSLQLCKVFVSNISYRVTTIQLSAFFSKFGRVVSCSIPAEAGSLRRKSRGIAFITFKSAEEAERAKAAPPEELTFYDRTMTVSQALPPKKRRGIPGLPSNNSFTDFDAIPASPSLSASDGAGTPDEEPLGRNILDLNDADLVRIFQMLSTSDRTRIERVCKRFLEQSMNAWSKCRRLCFENTFSMVLGRSLSNQVLKSILHRCGRYVEQLDLSGASQLLDDMSLQIVSALCPRLRHIDLTGVKVHWRALKGLAESCVCLQSIALRNSCSLNEKGFWWLFRHCNELKSIDLSGCKKLSGRCFRLLSMSVESANFNECSRIEPATVEDLCRQCPNLVSLQLNRCELLGDETCVHICKLSNLQILNLGNASRRISTQGLLNLAKMDSLRELCLANCKALTDEILCALAEGCPQLSLLNLSGAGPRGADTLGGVLTSKGFEAICTTACNLQDADFSYHAQLQDAHIGSLAAFGRLRNLKLRGCTITDAIAQPLAEHCAELWELDLSGCLRVTNALVQQLLAASGASAAAAGRKQSVTVVVGGTSCEPRYLATADSRIVLDTKDYSKHFFLANKEFCLDVHGSESETSGDEGDEDEFDALSLSRSFVLGGIEEDDNDDECDELPLD